MPSAHISSLPAPRTEGGRGTTTWPVAPPSFAVDAPGAPEPAWVAALGGLPSWSPPSMPGTVVVVAPHPDDETLGVGGLLAQLFELGWEVRVVAVTDGEAAYGAQSEGVRRDLARRRRLEQEAALHCLQAGAPSGRGRAPKSSIVRLGLPDGSLAEAGTQLVDALSEVVADATWCLGPLHWDGHPDHEACARALHEASAGGPPVAEYPIWAWQWGTPEDFPVEDAVRVDLPSRARACKTEALLQFASQYDERAGDGAVVPPHVLGRFQRSFEVLVP